MGQADFLKLGDSNAICDDCGFKFKHSQLKMDWRGLMLCRRCWQPRHPQEFLRGVPDKPDQQDPRPDPTPTYLPSSFSVTTPSFPASGTSVQNDNVGPVSVEITGGTVSSVVIAGWPAQPVLGNYYVAPGDSITVNYTGSPSWAWSPV